MRAHYFNGDIKEIDAKIRQNGDCISVTISKDMDFSQIRSVDIEYFECAAKPGDEGYMLLPRCEPKMDYGISFFRTDRENYEKKFTQCNMPVFGVKNDRECYVAYVSGMSYSFYLNVSNTDGLYRIYPTFEIDGEQPYEDICIEYFMLTGDDVVIGAEKVEEGKTLLTVTENGFGKRTELPEYLRTGPDGEKIPQSRGGKGLKNYNITAKTGKVAGCRVVSETDDVMLIENGGVIIRVPASSINIYKRDVQGVIVMRIEEGNQLVSLERVEAIAEEETQA